MSAEGNINPQKFFTALLKMAESRKRFPLIWPT